MSTLCSWILEIYRPFRKVLLVMCALMTAKGLLDLSGPYLLGLLINNISAAGPQSTSLLLVVLSLLAYLLGLLVTGSREVYSISRFDYDAPVSLSSRTLRRLLTLSVGQHRQQHSGVVQTTIIKGEQALHSLAHVVLGEMAPLALHVIPTLAALVCMNALLGAIVSAGVLSFVCVTLVLGRSFERPLASVRDLGIAHNRFQAELLRNVSLIQVNAQEAQAAGEYRSSAETHAAAAKSTWRRFVICTFANFGQLGLVRFLVLLAAVYYAAHGRYPAGSVVVFVLWTQSAIGELHRVANIQRRLAALRPDLESYLALLQVEPQVVQARNAIRPSAWAGAIVFHNVTFQYPEAAGRARTAHAADNLSFVVAPGEKVGFVGFSGAGKSTIVSLLLRAYDPVSGQIFVDGYDLRDLDLEHYRRHVGVVEQSVLLFDNTIRYNVLCSIPEELRAVDDRLEKALSMARVDEFASRMPAGLETRVGESGVSLSGGECQRVAIARALVKRPSILILDEATSHLDAINESRIMENIEQLARGCTTIVIAHRVSTVSRLDRIFVLDRGRIVAAGAHEELLRECDIYRELATKQGMTAVCSEVPAAVC